jgi:uncharacterized protein (TIGR02996 family)
MSDRDALLAAIQAAPDDDAPRLIYADWLEEHGDPDRAEFIRVQIELDPFERSNTDIDRFRRAVIRKDPSAPLPDDFPKELERYAGLVEREHELSDAHWRDWYGSMERFADDYESHLRVDFRRGFAEEVGIAATAFLAAGDAVRQACPALRRLVLYGPRHQLPELTAMSALAGVPEVDLAGWITEFDARFLATFLAENPVRSLTLWIGSENDPETIRTLATCPWAEDAERPFGREAVLAARPYLGRLKELVLVQLSRDYDARTADSLAAMFDDIVGRSVARVERPFARRVPLRERVGHGLWAGHVHGRPALVSLQPPATMVLFNEQGRWPDAIDLSLDVRLRAPSGGSDPPWERSAIEHLGRNCGFVPGTVFVHEFAVVDRGRHITIEPWGTHENVVAKPDDQLEGDEHEEACASLHSFWMKDGNFAIGDVWAGPDGRIHTS